MTDLEDPNPLSGMPYRMANALRAQNIEIVPILTREPRPNTPSLYRRFRIQTRSIRIRRTPLWFKRILDRVFPGPTRRAAIARANSMSACAQRKIEALHARGEQIDALFGCCISTALYGIETDLPIVYFSDATSPVLQKTYPVLSGRGQAFRDALHEIERISLQRTSMAVFAAPSTQASAIGDFRMDPTRTRVVPMGAHVYPANPDSVIAPAEPPTRERCDLLIVAADPIRKRVDLATEATEILRERGVQATLHVVGKGTPHSNSSVAVDSIGPLRLSDPDDRIRHQQLLQDSHIQLLPSLGEAFGIAPIESAHFARPSVVAGAGGLPFVVLDGQTGIVLEIDAEAETWADAIESLIDDPEHYRTLSTQCLERARHELNWDAWATSMGAIIRSQIGPTPERQESVSMDREPNKELQSG